MGKKMWVVQVKFLHSLEWQPWILSGPPSRGDLIQCSTFTPHRQPPLASFTTSDVGEITRAERLDGRLPTIREETANKPFGALRRLNPGDHARWQRIVAMNDDIQLLLDDGAAGRFDNPRCTKYAGFLRDVPEDARRNVAGTGRITSWLRDSAEFDRLEHARCFFVLERTGIERRRLLDDWIFPIAKLLGLQESRCYLSDPRDILDHRLLPVGVTLSFDESIFGLGGSSVKYSRSGVQRDEHEQQQQQQQQQPAAAAGQLHHQHQQQQHEPQRWSGGPPSSGAPPHGASSSRVDAVLRQLVEFSGAERRMVFEQLQREFGGGGAGGEMERRRERSAPRVAAAPSAACLCIPPPLLILEGVLQPMPEGFNPLVFPPAIMFS